MCCTSQPTNFNAAHPSGAMPPRRNSSCQRSQVLPKARQGKCSCCSPPHTNFKPRERRISRRQLTEALPKARPVLVRHLAAPQLQGRAPIQCDATTMQPVMPAKQSTAQARRGHVLRLAAPPAQRSAPVQCGATPLQPAMPAEHRTAQGKASAQTASRSTPTSSHAGGGSPHAS